MQARKRRGTLIVAGFVLGELAGAAMLVLVVGWSILTVAIAYLLLCAGLGLLVLVASATATPARRVYGLVRRDRFGLAARSVTPAQTTSAASNMSPEHRSEASTPDLQGAPEAGVGAAVTGHERMFAG